MAQRKTRTRRRRVKKSSKPKSKVDKKLSRRITKLEKQKEMKYYDVTSTTTPSADGVALSLVQGIVRGDQYNEREGDNLYTSGLRYSYILTKPAPETGDSPTYQIRVMFLWDKQNNAGTSFNIFTSTSPTSVLEASSILDDRDGMTNINAPLNMMTKDRFKILYDKIHIINSMGGTSTIMSQVYRGFIKLSGAKVQYTDSGDSGDISEVVSRNLICLYFCAGSVTTAINLTTRVYYHDD